MAETEEPVKVEILCVFTCRFLASFLSVRETVPQAYRLLGQIEETVGNKQNAVEAYKRYSAAWVGPRVRVRSGQGKSENVFQSLESWEI